MTYATFLLVFLVPPIVLLALWRRPVYSVRPSRQAWWGIPMLCLIALVYTTPWDNYLVSQAVWGYPPGRVIGTIGYVPIEEYCFFILQPIMTGLYLYRTEGPRLYVDRPTPSRDRSQIIGLIGSAVVTLVGIWQVLDDGHGRYMGLMVAWVGPVWMLLTGIGGDYLWAHRGAFLRAVAVPTLYLCLADTYAIYDGIWYISLEHTYPLKLGGILPIEEAVFFLLTNSMVCAGLLLWLTLPFRRLLP
ncbi:MAG: lycopene cyclase domain-containing protein [Bacteroidota bacterium]